MASYESLSQEQKEILHEGERLLRAWWRQVIAGDIEVKVQYLKQTWKPIKDSLDADEVVPNSSGLGGVTDLTKEDLQVLYADMKSVNDDIQTGPKFARIVKAIGINAG